MSFNGSGLFVINSTGQPVVSNTSISSTVFNAFTADMATGLSNCITKDGQTTVTADIPMGSHKITGLAAGTATTDAARIDNANALAMCEFRLSLTSGVPVTTSDVTGATTVYLSPYKGNRIALWDGTAWHMRTSAEVGLLLGGLTSGFPYDIFAYDNAGVVTLASRIWNDATNRNPIFALTQLNGVLVESALPIRRYLGTIVATGVASTEDSLAKRYVWNYYNRVRRPMRAVDTTNSWNYTLTTIRQANAAAANQLNFVVGVQEDVVSADILAAAFNSGGAVNVGVGIGLDTTTAFTSGCLLPFANPAAGVAAMLSASIKVYPAEGKHFLSWNEYSGAAGTTTWIGDNGTTNYQSGIHGEVWG